MTTEHQPATLEPVCYYKATTLAGTTPDAWERVETFEIRGPIRWTLDDYPDARGVSVHHELTSDHYRVER